MRHKFVHEFEDDPPHGDFEVDLDVPAGAKIQFDLDAGNIWVSANRAGWLHLARGKHPPSERLAANHRSLQLPVDRPASSTVHTWCKSLKSVKRRADRADRTRISTAFPHLMWTNSSAINGKCPKDFGELWTVPAAARSSGYPQTKKPHPRGATLNGLSEVWRAPTHDSERCACRFNRYRNACRTVARTGSTVCREGNI